MPFIITSKKLFPDNAFPAGSGIDYLNSSTGDRMKCVVNGYFKWSVEGVSFTFDSATKTITFTDSSVSGSFLQAGFALGDTFDSTGTVSNNLSLTIANVTDRTITTVESLTDEVSASSNVFGTTPITAIDYLYNLIKNSEGEDYNSRTDVGTQQRYTADGLDASVTTPVMMKIGTKSFGWVPDVVTGDVSEAFIEGATIVDYKQQFTITSFFRSTVLWSLYLQQNFTSKNPPPELSGNNSLKHICRIEGKYNLYSPIVAHYGSSVNTNGAAAWFNQNSIGSRPEYDIVSVEYRVTNSSGVIIPRADASIQTHCKLILSSRSGKFVDALSKFILSVFQNPKDPTLLINTPDTTLLQNIREDECRLTIGDTGVNGINTGTPYESITKAACVWIDANNVEINFKILYSRETKAYILSKGLTDRQYTIAVSCQDVAIVTTDLIDRVNVICDFNNADYDQRDSSLMGAFDYWKCYKFPDVVTNAKNNIIGFEGEYWNTQLAFYLNNAVVDGVTPTLKDLRLQVVATKSGENDFIVEDKSFDVSQFAKVADNQQINISETRGFVLKQGSVWNQVKIIRVPALDDTGKVAFMLFYPVVLRYELCREAINTGRGGVDKTFNNINNVWSKYSQIGGWGLHLRLAANIEGYDGFITPFQLQTQVVIYPANTTFIPVVGTHFQTDVKYYNADGIPVPGILANVKTRIVAIFTGDVSIPADYSKFIGTMFSDSPTSGSIFKRKFASTETEAESDNPFSSNDLLPDETPTEQWQTTNLRIRIFAGRVEIDTFYTNTNEEKNIIIVPELGYIGDESGLVFSDYTPILYSDLQGIQINE